MTRLLKPRKCHKGHDTFVGLDCSQCKTEWAKGRRERRQQKIAAGEWVPPIKKYPHKPKPKKPEPPPPPPRILVDEWTEFDMYGISRKRFYA